ncbi:MAG TPA: hypothetical protein VMJ72_01930 [Candidatus Paceibacterota bacterium]|nr:hypothetical protein [Candidatus Paceibacterota bacterium]
MFTKIKSAFLTFILIVVALPVAFTVGFFASYRIFGPTTVGVVAIFSVAFIEATGILIYAKASKTVGQFLAIAGMIILVSTILQFKFSGFFALGGAGIDIVNRAAENRALLVQTPKAVPCAEPFVVGDPEHARPRYWWSPKDDPIVCYDRQGRHPKYGTLLIEVSGPIVDLIETERTRPTPAPPQIVYVSTDCGNAQREAAWSPPVIPSRQ